MTPRNSSMEAVGTLERARDCVAELLRVDAAEIEADVPLALYGLDSVASLELVEVLERAFQRDLPDWFAAEHPTLAALASALDEPADAQASERELIERDVQLAADIRPSAAQARAPRRVLLTGSTGFLGAYILHELMRRTSAAVDCLVRARPGEGLARVQRNLERYGLWDPAFKHRLCIVAGDLTKMRFGLTPRAYAEMTEAVDSVIHAAADVSWVQPYSALRAANVEGAREAIRFASTGRGKALHFVSSLSVCYANGGPAVVDERTDVLAHISQLPLGYARSKVVAEALVQQAAARGLTAHIYRPSLILGDSATGSSNHDDIVASLLKGCIQMGVAPDLDWTFDAAPVDHVARVIVRTMTGDTPSPRVLHLKSAHPRHWRECVLWTNLFGYPLRLVSFHDWQRQLRHDAQSPAHALHALRPFFLQPVAGTETAAELYQDSRRSLVDATATLAVERAAGLDCPRLDAQMLDRFFGDYVARGFLLAPGGRRGDRGVLGGAEAPPSIAHGRTLARLLCDHFDDRELRIRSQRLVASGSEHSVISELTSWKRGKAVGLFHYRLALEGGRSAPATLDVMVKAKPKDDDVIEVAEALATMCDPVLGQAVRQHRHALGLCGSHVREGSLYAAAPAGARQYMPACYGTWRDDQRGEWGLAIEYLSDVVMVDTADHAGAWTPDHIDAALAGLTAIQAAWHPAAAFLRGKEWMAAQTQDDIITASPLWLALAAQASPAFSTWGGHGLTETHRGLAASIADWWPALDDAPATLVHHDFNTRNIALRRDGQGYRLCAYDWELATIGAPQRDLVEFLCFTLGADTDAAVFEGHLEAHRRRLADVLGVPIARARWRAGVRSALADMLVRRLAFYALIHRVRPQRWLPRVVRTWTHLFALTSRWAA